MSEQTIERISEIHIANSRPRARARWQLMVADIREVGLKKLVTVARRTTPSSDGKIFDLICGKGRVEAFIALEETHIPVVIIEARREDQFLMSLVENIARRSPSNRDILREGRSLLGRAYSIDVYDFRDGNAVIRSLAVA